MIFRKKELIDRPEVERKFSLKNPEDIAIIITFPILILIVILIIFLMIKFGNMIPEETSLEVISTLLKGGNL